jgi:polar amino acid transport system permease protein
MGNLSQQVAEFMPILLKGTYITIQITVVSIIMSTVWGFVLSLGLRSDKRFIYIPARFYINIIRGTPLLVQMFYVYFVFPDLGIQLTAFQAAIVSLTICYGAYHAEIFRAGILSIPQGQWEAAKAIGLKPRQIMAKIILPQAARVILPPIGNSFIILLKDSSLASAITVRELTRSGQLLASTTFENMRVFTMVALIYIVMTQVLAWTIHLTERRFRIL